MGSKRESKKRSQHPKEGDSNQTENPDSNGSHEILPQKSTSGIKASSDIGEEVQAYISAINDQTPRPLTDSTVQACRLVISSVTSDEAAYLVDIFNKNVVFFIDGIVTKALLFSNEFTLESERNSYMDMYSLELEPSGLVHTNASIALKSLEEKVRNENKLIQLIQKKENLSGQIEVSSRGLSSNFFYAKNTAGLRTKPHPESASNFLIPSLDSDIRKLANFHNAPAPLVLSENGKVAKESSEILNKSVRAFFYMSCAYYKQAINIKPRLLLVQEQKPTAEQALESKVKKQRL